MPDPDRLLRTLRQAVVAFRTTPGRKGRLIALTDAKEVLVAGDLHGNVENFRRILLLADLGKHPGRHLVLQELIHGAFRYPSGGDKSHQLVDLTAALKCQYPRQVHLLLGNHELAQQTGRAVGKVGKEGIDLNQQFRQGVEDAYGAKVEEVYQSYLQIFAAAPLAGRTPNRVFLSHSLPSASRLETFDPAALERDESTEGDLLVGGSVHSLVWGRDTRPETAAAFLQKVDADLLVTGHIPCERGYDTPNDQQLIVDCLGAPACCCLFPTDQPLSHAELVACVRTLS